MFKGQFLIFFRDRKLTWGYRWFFFFFLNAVNIGQLVLLFYKCNDIRRSFRSFVKFISTTDEKRKEQSKSPCVNTQSRWTPTHKNIYLSIHPFGFLHAVFISCLLVRRCILGAVYPSTALKHLAILIWLSPIMAVLASPYSPSPYLFAGLWRYTSHMARRWDGNLGGLLKVLSPLFIFLQKQALTSLLKLVKIVPISIVNSD